MQLQLSKKGRLYKGCTTEISYADRELAQFDWHVANVSSDKQKKPRYYAAHSTNKQTETFFGIGCGKTVYLHKVVLARKLNIPYADLLAMTFVHTDHRDHNRLNNKRSNIRPATPSQNNQNKRTGPYKGVYKTKDGKFFSAVQADGVFHYCGCFDTRAEAKQARDEMAKKLHGRFFCA